MTQAEQARQIDAFFDWLEERSAPNQFHMEDWPFQAYTFFKAGKLLVLETEGGEMVRITAREIGPQNETDTIRIE